MVDVGDLGNSGDSYNGGSSYGYTNSESGNLGSSRSGARYLPWQRQNIDQVLPQIQDRFSNLQPTFSPERGGQSSPRLNIPIVQAFTPQQIQARTNSYFSDADTRTGTQARLYGQQAAGRGFGANSPYIQELTGAADARNYRTAMENAREFDIEAANRNAGLELASWQARIQDAARFSQEDVARRQLAASLYNAEIQRENALLNQISQYLSPLPFSESNQNAFSRSNSENWSVWGGATEG